MWPTCWLPASQDIPIPFSGKLKVPLGGLLCLLQKGVQDVDSFFELRQVEDSMLHAGVDPQLLDTGPHAGHGLPVIRAKPLLDQVQLIGRQGVWQPLAGSKTEAGERGEDSAS